MRGAYWNASADRGSQDLKNAGRFFAPPRSTQALPLLMHSAAASLVTLGRLS